MVKIITLIVVLFATVAHSAVTFQRAEYLYLKMLAANHIVFARKLFLNKSQQINAKSSGFAIQINQGMLEYLQNDDELLLVLGHELAHTKLWHWQGSTHKNEYAADALGAKYAKNTGANICTAVQFHARMGLEESRSHPSSASRVRALGC
jgi:predicted Zn-dependent protease